ncbi:MULTISPECIES: DUF3368 domain-containing protein [Cyanophyceae]|uniref:DUF3368 domain-containing protein n=1 Tax=Leptolyngbya subtilissima DQ-A4 TaxID=2933933 RepID=A0ABV0K195_9CYAN|nr:DUF3368 domain-containing protein [Nodosilinea sp. FACHB-141]MBD2111312.1 DUF3368 domain-containing protein [Nodosilinea sp. FACHB-141]
MLEVIADTSVMQYLFQTNHLFLLPSLYDNVVLPDAVRDELETGQTLGISLPKPGDFEWIQLVCIDEQSLVPQIPGLGRGEREVLSLAVNRPGSVALLDDGLARQYAKRLKIGVTGTLGVLLKAKQYGLIVEVGSVLKALNQLGFRVSEETRLGVLRLAAEA